ncbi:SDR family oxidoreductase [Streptomyces sp. NPDC059637]|uniref:SDR family oxidoreductase n=1 Tax=Streptomyces sp. NPDC059637 TaxID=3347752 RepID=UPI0036C51A99
MARRVVVTGSASGIGRAAADMLRARGDRVVGVDLKEAEVCADLSAPEGRRAALEALTALFGDGLDAVVACAGIAVPVPEAVGVNYFGVTELLTGLRPLLARGTDPRAVTVGSITVTQPFDAELVEACLAGDEPSALRLAQEAAGRGEQRRIYPSSKNALVRWVRRTCVAPGWADAGIPLNAVGPGTVRTPMTDWIFADPEMKAVMDAAVPMPLNGYASPEAVAKALLWLADPDNTHVTGQLVYVDGGAEAVLRGDAAP